MWSHSHLDVEYFSIGFTASFTAGLLTGIRAGKHAKLSREDMTALQDARELLDSVIVVHKFMTNETGVRVPTKKKLDGFGILMDLVLTNRGKFGIERRSDLLDLWRSLLDTLDHVIASQDPDPTKLDQAISFFRSLAEAMLAKVSRRCCEAAL